MLYLRKDQAKLLLRACEICAYPAKDEREWRLWVLKQKLAVRYFMFNGLSPMELANARIEHMDPISRELYLPKRHWKRNCVTTIDPETVRLQIMYSGSRKKGPLLRSYKTKGHFTPRGFWRLIKTIAMRTNIPGKESITPLVLKRTYARLYLKTRGNTVAGLQKSFSHKHLWSTAHYLIFVLDDVHEEKARMMKRVEGVKVHPMNRLERSIQGYGEEPVSARVNRRGKWQRKKGARDSSQDLVYNPFE